jgi:pimeloyl-ACP methyl ester carboxylesterase
VTRPAPASFEAIDLAGADIRLKAWRLRATERTRGVVIYLHGVADNRMSGLGIGRRFAEKGFDVIAYDSRAHGESGGEACTYGFYEKRDLIRVLDTIAVRPIVLFGVSLGAAVALQTAALDDRVGAVVAVETFSDLTTVARERAPSIMTQRSFEKAIALAERRAAFQIRDVSPVAAAADIRVPVLLIHGASDHHTPLEHSRRVFEALPGPKRLFVVPNAGHNQSLSGPVWSEIDEWLDAVIPLVKPG